ncbi:MAG: hypothetical protein HY537_14790 [Deltaproteobacteria bacterium]|nr:hypothetical protein [Deltaproteobacteria bacterium]
MKVHSKRISAIVLWTLVMLLALWGVDRLLFGPLIKEGWIQTTGTVPAEAGPRIATSYLPDYYVWPASLAFYRIQPTPGWWLALLVKGRQEPSGWLGFGKPELPTSLNKLQDCFTDRRCPPGWELFSRQFDSQGVIHLIIKAPSMDAGRIMNGLRIQSANR